MSSIQNLRKQIPTEVFEDQDFRFHADDLTDVARQSMMKRWLKKGDIQRVSRGCYVFGEKWRKHSLSTFIIAGRLYSPSYVSFESALSHHGLIPESVPATTSACFQQKKKNFTTPFGVFTYSHIPSAAFTLGVAHHKTSGGSYLLASPLKALFDLVYQQRKSYLSLAELEADLRIDLVALKNLVLAESYSDLETLATAYRKKNCLQLLQILNRELR